MNEPFWDSDKFWNWKFWQVMKWVTGAAILLVVLALIGRANGLL